MAVFIPDERMRRIVFTCLTLLSPLLRSEDGALVWPKWKNRDRCCASNLHWMLNNGGFPGAKMGRMRTQRSGFGADQREADINVYFFYYDHHNFWKYRIRWWVLVCFMLEIVGKCWLLKAFFFSCWTPVEEPNYPAKQSQPSENSLFSLLVCHLQLNCWVWVFLSWV